MDRIGYEETLKVSYFQIDGNRNMSPAALLSCLQEAAVTHSDTIGYTLDYMAEHQWGWSVVNWHLQIYRMPQHGERIQVQTWSNKCMRFQAERSFFLFDEAGNKLLDGASRWIFMDLARRRPANAPDGMAERYHSGQEWAMDDVPDEIYDGMSLADVRIVYRKECVRGDIVEIKTYVRALPDGKEVLSFLSVGEKIVAEVATLWR